MACAISPVAAEFSATFGAPVRRSAGAYFAPRAAFTANSYAPMRRSPGHLASYAALAAAGDAPVRPRCARANRAQDLAFPTNALTPAAVASARATGAPVPCHFACLLPAVGTTRHRLDLQ